MSKVNRKIFSYRNGKIIRSHEMKKIIDVAKYKLRADEMKSFIIFASSYLLEGLVDDHIMQMAIYLRRYIIALYQETPNEENLREGLRCLREFAKIAEEHNYYNVLTIGLHIEVCETLDNVKANGPPIECLGSWVERLVGMMVKITDHRVSQKPEVTMTKEYLLNRHLESMSSQFLTFQNISFPRNSNFVDPGANGIKFIGNGKRKIITPAQKIQINEMLLGYGPIAVEIPNVCFEFQQLQIKNCVFHSRKYLRTKVSNSTGCEVIYNEISAYGRIETFLYIPTTQGLRLAEVTFFHPRGSSEWGIPTRSKQTFDPVMILAQTINSKVVFQELNAGDSFYSILYTPSYSSNII